MDSSGTQHGNDTFSKYNHPPPLSAMAVRRFQTVRHCIGTAFQSAGRSYALNTCFCTPRSRWQYDASTWSEKNRRGNRRQSRIAMASKQTSTATTPTAWRPGANHIDLKRRRTPANSSPPLPRRGKTSGAGRGQLVRTPTAALIARHAGATRPRSPLGRRRRDQAGKDLPWVNEQRRGQ